MEKILIQKKLNFKIDDLEELKEDLDKKIENTNLFVCRGRKNLNEELFSIVGSIKKYEILEDGTAEFYIQPLMLGYEKEIKEADEIELSISDTRPVEVKRIILLKNGEYI